MAEGQTTRLSAVWASSLHLSQRPGRPPKSVTEGDTQTQVGSEHLAPGHCFSPACVKRKLGPWGRA